MPGRDDSGDVGRLDDHDRALYTVGQVAEILDVPPAALRRMDDADVVRPSRSAGNQRRYSRRQIERIREVLDLTAQGVTLVAVRRVLDLQDRVADLEVRLAESESRLAEIRARLAEAESSDASAADDTSVPAS